MKRSPMPERRMPLSSGKGLAPGKPLARRTPMPRATGPAQGAPLRRAPLRPTAPQDGPATPPVRPSAPRRTPRASTGPAPAVLALVRARDGGLCWDCGFPGTAVDPLVPHHRRNRGAGGSRDAVTQSPANLVLVHASANGAYETSHGHELARIRARGLKLSSWQDPRTAPVVDHTGTPWLLGEDGSRTRVDTHARHAHNQ